MIGYSVMVFDGDFHIFSTVLQLIALLLSLKSTAV